MFTEKFTVSYNAVCSLAPFHDSTKNMFKTNGKTEEKWVKLLKSQQKSKQSNVRNLLFKALKQCLNYDPSQ